MPHLTLLGGAVLEDEAGPISGPAGRRHPLALLALLATAPSRTRSRSKVAGLLWPDAPESTARSRLNTCLYRVRSGLGSGAVVSAGDDLRLDPDAVRCDVIEFEEALEADEPDRAVELYDGPFLDGFRLKGAPEFENWLDRERGGLAERYRDALESLAERAEQRDDPTAAARWWRKRVREQPHDSRVVGRLTQALAAAGNRAEALRVARTHERLLQDELGTAPDADVRELAEHLEDGDPERGVTSDRRSVVHYDGEDAEDAEDVGPTRAERDDAARAAAGGTPGDDSPDGGGGRRATVAAALLVAAVFAGLWYLATGRRATSSYDGDPVVAVLPFEAVGGSETRVIAEGMHGDLLTRLAGISSLGVIASTSVERYRDGDLSVAAIADSLDATWIVEGEVQRADGRIRVTAHLVEPTSRREVWADSYQRDLTARGLFDLQADIARNIVRSVQARLTVEEADRVERRPTDDLGAYRSYLRGRNRLEERTESATLAATSHFRDAVREDSSFALAWARLAETAVLIGEYGYGPLTDSLVAPERAARRALSLDSTLAQAHMARGYLHLLRAEGPGAVRSFRRAVDLQPGSSGAQFRLGEALALVGRIDGTVEHVERAVELDPLAPFPRIALGGFYHLVGRHQDAIRQIRQGQTLASDLAISHLLEGQALASLGRHEEALRALERGRELAAPTSIFAGVLKAWPAVVHARNGDTARARQLMSTFETTPSGSFDRAVVHAALGEEAAALAALRRARLTDHYFRTFMFRYAPVFDPLRDDAGYRDLLGRVNRRVGLRPDGSLRLAYLTEVVGTACSQLDPRRELPCRRSDSSALLGYARWSDCSPSRPPTPRGTPSIHRSRRRSTSRRSSPSSDSTRTPTRKGVASGHSPERWRSVPPSRDGTCNG